MSLRYADPFDFWTSFLGTFSSGTNGTISGGALTINITTAPGTGLTKVLDAQNKWIFNFTYNYTSGSNINIINVLDGSTVQCSLVMESSGQLSFYRGLHSGTKISSDSSTVLVGGRTYDIEVEITLGNTGSCKAWINGNLEINATSVDNTATSNNTADRFRIGPAGSSFTTFSLGHLIAMDGQGSNMNGPIGPVNVQSHTPTSDGNYTTWTPNTGTRYQAVDETNPNGNTDYVAASSVGDKITFGFSDSASSVTNIIGVGVWVNAARDDATTRGFKVLTRNGTTDVLGSNESFVGPSYDYYFSPFEISPFSSLAWSKSEFDATEWGAEVTT